MDSVQQIYVTMAISCTLSTLFSNTLNLCSSLKVRDQDSQPYNTTGRHFFQGQIGRDIKTRVKIRNILFATFRHTCQLLLYTLQYFRPRSQPPVLSVNSLRWSAAHFANCCPPTTVSYEERDENHRELSPGG